MNLTSDDDDDSHFWGLRVILWKRDASAFVNVRMDKPGIVIKSKTFSIVPIGFRSFSFMDLVTSADPLANRDADRDDSG